MGNFNLTITNEGAALLADVIANQGSLEFTEVRFSSTNYVGSEAALTEGTFGGTFITAVPSASILSQTTIDIAASFDNTTFTIAKQLYSIGVIAEDGDGNTVLVAVCTTSVPDTIPAYMAPGSNYAFNINMTVSSTNGITVTGSVAGVLYVSDIVDNLNSHETNKPLSANQGRVLMEMIPASGMFPHVIVISDSGSVVTLTKGAKVITASETSTGHFEADVDEYGTWTIDSILGGDDAQTTLNIDAVKIYTITDAHFSASITVSYPSGGTCTLSATGQTPQVATGSPYTFTVHAAATYTLTATYRGATRTGTVVISTTGEAETYSFLVDGATVLTTDDVEIWLDCACLWDKNYTTEAEIIADSEALLALISDHNAVDYMVRSASFRTLICADALAMLYIGQYNYCADALIADSTWRGAICDSEYFELVLTDQVPVMTSNTTPSGEAFGSECFNVSIWDYFYVFNKDYRGWYSEAFVTQTGQYVGYMFNSKKQIYQISLKCEVLSSAVTIKFQASDDGSTWEDITSNDTISASNTGSATHKYKINANYQYYRLYIVNGPTTDGNRPGITVFAIALYGRTDVVAPTRTLKTFATANRAEILEMVCRADRGEIDLYDDAGWRWGQEHSTTVGYIHYKGTEDGGSWEVGEGQRRQTATFALMHHGLYELVNPVLDTDKQTRNTCSFVVGLKDCLNDKGYINPATPYINSWSVSARRDWCNYGFRAALPAELRAAFKQFKCISSVYNGSSSGDTNAVTQDYFSLAAEKEYFGTQQYSTTNEANALTQFTYYETPANIIKNVGGTASSYWARSHYYANDHSFCNPTGSAGKSYNSQDASLGIAPFGCL